MIFFLPPYGKRHIIVLASLTFFIAISVLFAWKMQADRQANTTTATTIQAQDLRNNQDITAPFTLAQLGNQSAAWGDNQFVMYDIRSTEDFTKSHIEGAISVPLAWLDRTAISSGATVVVYSDSIEQLDQAKSILKSKSITKIYTLNDPLTALSERGFVIYEQ